MTAFPQNDPILSEEIEEQLRKCSESLQRLGSLLGSSDSIPRPLFQEFREAVNRVRITAWIAQRSLADRDGVPNESLIAQERVRAITSMCEQVAEFLSREDTERLDGLDLLAEALAKV